MRQRRTFPVEARGVYPTHRFFPTRVRFLGTIPHGKGTRQVAMDIDPELICKIADALRATLGHACDAGRFNSDHRDGVFNPGHAIWHVENPEHPMPCIDPNTVIDLNSLPAGSEDPDK